MDIPLGLTFDDVLLTPAESSVLPSQADVRTWESLDRCLQGLESPRWFAVSTRGGVRHDGPQFAPGDADAEDHPVA